MNASPVNVIHAVWLDPFSPIDIAERAQLSTAGISLETVSTLGDLTLALRRAHVLVIRLGDSAELLQEVQTLVAQLGHTVPVLCRIQTLDELEYFQNGGILHYVLRHLAS